MRSGFWTRALGGAAALTLLAAGDAAASGFALRENSAEALGTAFAGNASSATFLSTIFNNPAGMTHFTGDRGQVDASFIVPSSTFNGAVTESGCHFCVAPPPAPPVPLAFPISGQATGVDPGQTAVVPAIYAMHSISPDLKVGLAITVPFGLETKYPETWAGRYFGIESKIQTFDINPNVAYRVNNWLSVGGGVSAQYFYALFTNAIDQNAIAGAPPAAFGGPFPDARLRLSGSDWGVGFNAGVLLEPLPGTNIGATYRSRVHHTLDGNAVFSGVALPAPASVLLSSSAARVGITTPDSVDVSITQAITDRLHVSADAQWTHWSLFQMLAVTRTSGILAGSLLTTPTPENFRDTYFFALGGTFNLDDNWTFRAGAAFDRTPVRGTNVTVRLADNNRYWISAGVGYKFSDGFSVDLGASHLIIPAVSLNNSVNSVIPAAAPGSGADTITGRYSNAKVELISLQTRFRF